MSLSSVSVQALIWGKLTPHFSTVDSDKLSVSRLTNIHPPTIVEEEGSSDTRPGRDRHTKYGEHTTPALVSRLRKSNWYVYIYPALLRASTSPAFQIFIHSARVQTFAFAMWLARDDRSGAVSIIVELFLVSFLHSFSSGFQRSP